jgi:predicted regulator of Ras-like GTPase activity (Roadblock/LC7/MglB family)
MTGDQALRELMDVSEDVVAAVILDRNGEPAAATVDEEAARRAAGIAGSMLAHADALRTGASVERLEAVTPEGSVFVVREDGRTAVAATGPDPVAGLVYHDLRATLRKLGRRTKEKASVAS